MRANLGSSFCSRHSESVVLDEIDAVGGTRKLKDQSAMKMTLNELLVQLDGFEENNGIIVIGATNFAESLDSALLRPGRFDKHVTVPLPDVGGRREILKMYADKTTLSKDVDLDVLARGTTGFSGADLYNLMNQAALKASVDGLNSITMAVLEFAKDKILMGAERKTAVITAKTAKCTAYHEAGHALQHQAGYAPLKLRSSLVPVTSIASNILGYVFIAGMFGLFTGLAKIAVICFLVLAFFQLITLPVESYYLSSVPISIDIMDLILINGSTILLCFLALILPSQIISRINVVKVIKFE